MINFICAWLNRRAVRKAKQLILKEFWEQY